MIELNAHGANIKIEAHSKDLDCQGWCRVRVYVQTNGFEGNTIAWLLEEDLRVFQKQLVLMMENLGKASSARLSSAEPDLDIQLKMNRLGKSTAYSLWKANVAMGYPPFSPAHLKWIRPSCPH